MVSPLDLEQTFGLTGGNIFQGAMNLNQLFLLRPVVGYANYRTPIPQSLPVRLRGASQAAASWASPGTTRQGRF